jgi:hypothetical protein
MGEGLGGGHGVAVKPLKTKGIRTAETLLSQ